MTPLALAVLAGVGVGLGLWILSSAVPRLSRPTLVSRVAPYVLDLSAEARRLVSRRSADPSPVFGALAAPVAGGLRTALSRVLGGDEAITRRLRQAGSVLSVEAFRSRQLVWAAVGAAAGVGVAALVWRTGTAAPLVGVAAIPVGTGLGLLLPEQVLARGARARLARMADELPTVLEFLALSLSAGESLPDALRRVARASSGELARDLAAVVADVHLGVPLATALTGASDALGLPGFTRCVDQLVPALDRGTPLVDVLRAQTQDAREETKRGLIESAGKKEVAMLVPLVFLILPITVAFAVFPATLVLDLGF
ncbi:MAG: type II secretion system F family protein [Micrococcales bacterium]|nr:type II secretion system F family protein [Micrococcales bacterium]